MPDKELLLSVCDLHKCFALSGRRVLKAVNGISLDIYKGETVGLVGESGCGKTTLGRAIVKLYKPTSGTICYRGRDIWGFGKSENLRYHKDVQIIYQDPYASLDPLTVICQSIAEGIDVHKLCDKKDQLARVYEILQKVGLSREHANRFPHEFSGGQRQRIGIARALAVEPQLIVCDEPISALDVSIQAQIVNLLMALQRGLGLSYLFITHDLSMVKQISDRIAVMYLGSIMELALSGVLYERHMHPYTQALLTAIPIPNPRKERLRPRSTLSGDVPSPVDLNTGCVFCKRCPYADENCLSVKPELIEAEPGHFVACHHRLPV
jgi:oligopeptide transport system ATP-binding protein